MFNWIQLLSVLWHTTNLRVVILFSLFLQTFLFFSAPLRKRTSNSLITIPMWLAYNLADATAIFGVGLISKPCGNALGAYANPELVALWAPFFLLHLGGPDTITAFALEDNELWLRHLLQLVVQLTTSAYVFIHTLSSNNQFWLPTLLMFISALIKTTERNRSLYLASWRRFRDSMIREPNPGPNYPNYRKLFSNYESSLPPRPEVVEAPNPETSVGDNNEPHLIMGAEFEISLLESVYLHFGTVKGLIADFKFSSREREKNRSVFLKLTPKKAFESVMIELNFLYDILFTKTPVLHGYFGFIPSRFVSSASCLAAFVLFHLMDPKHKFSHHKIDVEITYTLLLAAIVKDLIAFFVISTSDWASVSWNEFKYKHALDSNFTAFLFRLWSICNQTGFTMKAILFKFIMPFMKRRWSESISQFNLIFYSLHPRSKMWDKIIDYLGLTNILDRRKYVKTEWFNDDLRDFIFEELKIKSEVAVDIKTAKELRSAKGNWVLGRKGGCGNLLPYTLHADYDKILILWHIATELCYNTETTEEGNSHQNQKFREISKVLSDYMLYLLIMEPSMMSAVAGTAQIRFRDTCAEAKLFFQDKRVVLEKKEKYSCMYNMNSSCLDACLDTCCDHNCTTQRNGYRRRSNLCYSGHKQVMIQACNSILDVHTNLNPSTVEGDTSKTVLFEACILAKELRKLDKDKWEILSKVWVELLSYAAYRCDANSHATYLSKGGQLISLVWLLMVHLGLGDQFEVSS